MGGDFNSRLGDLNELSQMSLKWRYGANADTVSNSHGAQLKGICELHQILPLNHCRFYNHCWDGKFTFQKPGRQSQIDFCLTTHNGRRYVRNFKIIEKGWHLSDHLSLTLSLLLPCEINVHPLLLRSKELSSSSDITNRKSFTFKFNFDMAKSSLEERIPDIMADLMDGSPDIFLGVLVKTINPILTANRYKNFYLVLRNSNAINDKFSECDVLYLEYLHAMKNQSGDHIIKYDWSGIITTVSTICLSK